LLFRCHYFSPALDDYYPLANRRIEPTIEGKGGEEMYIGVGTVILILVILLLLILLF